MRKCAWCRKIFNVDTEKWEENDIFDNDNNVEFSHGICPECMDKIFPEYVEK